MSDQHLASAVKLSRSWVCAAKRTIHTRHISSPRSLSSTPHGCGCTTRLWLYHPEAAQGRRTASSSLVIRLVLAVWITLVVVVLCATRRWWGVVLIVTLLVDLYLLSGTLAVGFGRERGIGAVRGPQSASEAGVRGLWIVQHPTYGTGTTR
jgi:hypothetical protein